MDNLSFYIETFTYLIFLGFIHISSIPRFHRFWKGGGLFETVLPNCSGNGFPIRKTKERSVMKVFRNSIIRKSAVLFCAVLLI
ncbi:hypothetical protein GNF82_18230, partial [Clostridium perfringens]